MAVMVIFATLLICFTFGSTFSVYFESSRHANLAVIISSSKSKCRGSHWVNGNLNVNQISLFEHSTRSLILNCVADLIPHNASANSLKSQAKVSVTHLHNAEWEHSPTFIHDSKMPQDIVFFLIQCGHNYPLSTVHQFSPFWISEGNNFAGN